MDINRAPYPYYDTHCHLTSDAFNEDLDAVIDRMKAAGMAGAVTIGCEQADLPQLKALIQAHRGFLWGAWGLHPEYPDHTDPSVDEICEVAQGDGFVAVGETGLDFYWCQPPLEWQYARFITHIEAAKAVRKPLIIHARDSEAQAVEVLQKHAAHQVGFVMHCYCGDLETAQRAVDAGGLISFTGNLTFKKNDELRRVAQALPLSALMIETDAPYMAPVPYRGKRCEPAMCVQVAQTIADLKGVTLEQALKQTSDNARRFFGLGA